MGRFIGIGDDPLVHPLAALDQGSIRRETMAIVPARLNEQLAQMAVAGFGDSSPLKHRSRAIASW